MKTNKSYSKRIKVTKNGKLKSRKAGFNHFNAKASGSKRMAGRRAQTVSFFSNKAISRFLPGTKTAPRKVVKSTDEK